LSVSCDYSSYDLLVAVTLLNKGNLGDVLAEA
jgi:hypothetical protein